MYPERLVWYMCGFEKENAKTCRDCFTLIFVFSKHRNTECCCSVSIVLCERKGKKCCLINFELCNEKIDTSYLACNVHQISAI